MTAAISTILAERSEKLHRLRESPRLLQAALIHYRDNPWDYVRDWGMTYDPRAIESGGVATIPFIPWPRQVEYMQWLTERWKAGQRGLVEKSRDCGVTWLSVAWAVAMWATHRGMAIGIGSRKESLIDKLGDPDSIFEKLRFFVRHLPKEVLPPGFDVNKDAPYMRLISPETGSSITGEAGDNIGRGGRKAVYIIDEAAFLERQEVVDAALSATTNCQIDVSTFNGSGNLFYQKRERFAGTDRHFEFDWRQDPRKDDAWYQRQKAEQPPEIVAQEIDRDPHASNTDAFIPALWVNSAVDAHKKLGIERSGIRAVGFDPADTGDAKAAVMRYGSVVSDCKQLKEGDITHALPWVYLLADDFRADVLVYDADGMGAPVMRMDLQRRTAGRMQIAQYRGSGEVENPTHPTVPGDGKSKKNRDAYLNFRAQSWTWVRERFRRTHDAVERAQSGLAVNVSPDDIISLDGAAGDLSSLKAELSRPKRVYTTNGKIAVEPKKAMKARGVQSPNLADALVMAFSVKKLPDVDDSSSFEPDFEV